MSGFNQLDLTVNNFRSLWLGLIAVHLCAGLALLMAAIPLLIKIGGIVFCVVSLMRCLHQLLIADQYITALSCCPDEGWVQIYNRKGDALNILRINHYAVLPFLLVLNLSDDQRCGHWFLVPRDAVRFNDFRRLRVILAYHRTLPNLARQNSEVR